MVRTLKIISLLIGALSLSSCAQVVAPTGGEKDTTAPEVLEINPRNETLNFNSKEIEIEFDEYVVLKNLKNQLLVSPPLKYSLQGRTKGKKLIFEIKDTLKANTTYVLNFGNAIVDLNEGNPIPNFQYVFSTGSIIDSLTLSGTVADAFDLKLEEGALLLLYPSNSEDSAVSKQLPTYVSRTDKSGEFEFTNLQKGTYKLFALIDKNDTYKYDRPDEKIAFLNSPITLGSIKSNPKLYTFSIPETNQFIEKEEASGGKLMVTFKLPVKKLTATLIDTSIKKFFKFIDYTGEKTVSLWHQNIAETRLSVAIQHGNFLDTIKFESKELTDDSDFKLEKELSGTQNYFEPISLLFNHPIRSIDKDLISIFDKNAQKINFSLTIDQNVLTKATLTLPKKPEGELAIQFLPGSFKDIYGISTDSINTVIKFNTSEDFGTLFVKTKGKIGANTILQLTNAKGEVEREYFGNDSIAIFKNLSAASYGLKLIQDNNKNKKWDTGDYYKKRQPEKIIVYNEGIAIRQNWDKEIIWVIE
ncbi:MAG: hypothetical protein ACI91R_001282 [Vicingaceae bacterium]